MEYYAYRPGTKWWLCEVMKIILICIVVAELFYDRLWVAVVLLPAGILLIRNDLKTYKKRVKSKIKLEFGQLITLLSGSLNAGYSLEQGLRSAYEDMSGQEDFKLLERELVLIVNGLNLNKDPEKLLLEMGERCQVEDVIELAGLISTAKRYGGNMNLLIGKAKKNMKDKLLVEGEIDTLISAKRLEGNIMLFMPFVIVLYMRFTNGSYIHTLYDSIVGNVVATVALIVVLVCGEIIKGITRIEV